MMYLFDLYLQKGKTPTNNDIWLGRRLCSYHEIAEEVDQLNKINDNYIYFIRIK